LGEKYDHEMSLAYQQSQAADGALDLLPCVVILIIGDAIALDQVITASPIIILTTRPDPPLVAGQSAGRFAITAERRRQCQLPQGVPLLGVLR
jgi:hypothetical protein